MSSAGNETKATETDGNQSVAIREVIQSAKAVWHSETDQALSSAEESQDVLEKQLDALEEDLKRAAAALTATGVVGNNAFRIIHQAQESITRARRKLTTVRARMGRLRTFEEAHRLSIGYQ